MSRKTRAPKKARTPAQVSLRKKRKAWYLRSIIPALLILALTAQVTYTVLWNKHGVEEYQAGDSRGAIWGFNHSDRWLPAEQWVHPFNSGTAKAKQGALNSAFTDFTTAEGLAPSIDANVDYSALPLDSLPPLCLIRVNHAYAYEVQGAAALKDADVLWDTVNAQQETAARAPSEAKYKEHIDEARRHLVMALNKYRVAKDSYAQVVSLLSTYKCTDESLIENAQDLADQAQRKLDAGNRLQDPEWRPRNASQDPSDSEEEPKEPQQQGGEGSEEPEEPKGEDNPDGDSDQSEEEQTDGSTNQNFSSDEQARQEQLQERNKAGDVERKEAEAYQNSTTPSKKQW